MPPVCLLVSAHRSLLLILPGRSTSQLRAVSSCGLDDAPDWLAIPGLARSDRNFVPGFERVLTIASGVHDRRRLRLQNPVRDFAVLTFHVKHQQKMGAGVKPSRDGPLQDNLLIGCVRSAAVMCEERNRNQKPQGHSQGDDKPLTHSASSVFTSLSSPLRPALETMSTAGFVSLDCHFLLASSPKASR